MLLSDFARKLAIYVEGTPDDNGIHQALRPLNEQFLAEIHRTTPRFSPFESGQAHLYTHSKFLRSDEELKIYTNKRDVIYVDEVVDMHNK